MDFYKIDFIICTFTMLAAGVLCNLPSGSQDAESDGIGKGFVFMLAGMVCVAAVLKWLI